MKKFYSVEDAQKVLLKNRETVLRYIRNSIIKDKEMIAAFLKYDVISLANVKNDTAYLTIEEFNTIREEDFRPLAEDTSEILKYKERLKNAYYSLILENPNTKPYRIYSESLLRLLTKRYCNGDEKNARYILEQYEKSLDNNVAVFDKNEPLYRYEGNATDIQSNQHGHNADICRICDAFKDNHIKEKFIKGLYLLQIADGEIDEQETKLILDRAARLEIKEHQIIQWVPDPKQLDTEEILPQLKFDNMTQSIVFILEAIRLAYQDDKYTAEEKQLVRQFAAINNISEELLLKYEAEIEKEHYDNIFQEWKAWQK